MDRLSGCRNNIVFILCDSDGCEIRFKTSTLVEHACVDGFTWRNVHIIAANMLHESTGIFALEL